MLPLTNTFINDLKTWKFKCFFLNFLEKSNELEWCKVAYWELSQRVGRLFPVDTKSVNVFWNVPLGTGLSLAALTQHNFSPTQSPPESVLRNRTKIGQGK